MRCHGPGVIDSWELLRRHRLKVLLSCTYMVKSYKDRLSLEIEWIIYKTSSRKDGHCVQEGFVEEKIIHTASFL